MISRDEAQRVYGAGRKSLNESTRNTLKHSTCSHKWRETLKGSIFGVKLIPALTKLRGDSMVAPAEIASLQGFKFDSKQFREWFVTPLSCFPQPRYNFLDFWTSVLLLLLLDFDTYGGVDPLVVCPLFLKLADIIAPKLSIIFRRLIRQGSFLECRRLPMYCLSKGCSLSW